MKYFVYVSVSADSDLIFEDICDDDVEEINPAVYEEIAKNHIYEDIELFLKNGDVPVQQYVINIVFVPKDNCKQYVSVYNHKGTCNVKE